jgi:hypothetical protein
MADDSDKPGSPLKKCGTTETPPCPPPDGFDKARGALVHLIAGDDATNELIVTVTARVDTVLTNLMHGAYELLKLRVDADVRKLAATEPRKVVDGTLLTSLVDKIPHSKPWNIVR